MKQIEKIGRAQKGSYDSCPDLAAGKDPSPHKVTEREEYSPNQGGKRQETMVVGPAQKTSHKYIFYDPQGEEIDMKEEIEIK